MNDDVITVAEMLYYEANPGSRSDVPSFAYEQVRESNRRRVTAMSDMSLYDWCKKELKRNTQKN